MTSKEKKQLSFDDQIYPQPVEQKISQKNSAAAAKGKPAKSAKKALPDTLQPFLPGLSRRGRPRSKNPIPPSTRASESRKRRVEAGGKRIELLLESNAVADLDALVNYYKVTRAELLSRLLAKAAKSMRAKDVAKKT